MSDPTVQAADQVAAVPQTPGEVLLDAGHVKKYFPIMGGLLRHQIGQVYAVDDVSLQIYRGEKFGLVGESGCGKTTFGRTICGSRLPRRHRLDGRPECPGP